MRFGIKILLFGLCMSSMPLSVSSQNVNKQRTTAKTGNKSGKTNARKSNNQRLTTLAKAANEAFEKKQYNRAISLMDDYKKEKQLPNYGYYMLTFSCLKTAQDERCIEYGKEWERAVPDSRDEECKAWIYANIGVGCANLGRYEESNRYFMRSAELNKKNRQQYARDCESIGYNYWSLTQYDEARQWFERSATEWMKAMKVSFDDVQAGKVEHLDLGRVLFDWAMAHYACGDTEEGNRVVKMAAKCRYGEAEQYCREHLENQ